MNWFNFFIFSTIFNYMEKIINDRYNTFTTYCKNNLPWLMTKNIPQIQLSNKKETVFIEFRILPQ